MQKVTLWDYTICWNECLLIFSKVCFLLQIFEVKILALKIVLISLLRWFWCSIDISTSMILMCSATKFLQPNCSKREKPLVQQCSWIQLSRTHMRSQQTWPWNRKMKSWLYIQQFQQNSKIQTNYGYMLNTWCKWMGWFFVILKCKTLGKKYPLKSRRWVPACKGVLSTTAQVRTPNMLATAKTLFQIDSKKW